LIYSLIGQSEVLTAAGVYLISIDHSAIGFSCLALGIIGALCRYSANFSFLSKQIEDKDKSENLDKYETLSNLLTEISNSKK